MKNQKKKILVTGTSGYIGSSAFKFLSKKYNVYGLDKKKPIINSKKIFVINLLNKKKVKNFLYKIKPSCIIHLAGESLVDPKKKKTKYTLNNIFATQNLISCMKKNYIKKIIFSSTAAVYESRNIPITENFKTKPISNYAISKLKVERLIRKSKIKFIIFRFFNVASSLDKYIGENHKPETHLIPRASLCALKNKIFYIYGKDYKTKDGTCIRDFVHIKDICSFINFSIKYLEKNNKSNIFNVGSEKPYSVLQVVKILSKKTKLNYNFTSKRKSDPPILISSLSKVKKILKWHPIHSNIEKIINDHLNWLKFNFKN
jgi:UDP-glucose 4-epimerase